MKGGNGSLAPIFDALPRPKRQKKADVIETLAPWACFILIIVFNMQPSKKQSIHAESQEISAIKEADEGRSR